MRHMTSTFSKIVLYIGRKPAMPTSVKTSGVSLDVNSGKSKNPPKTRIARKKLESIA